MILVEEKRKWRIGLQSRQNKEEIDTQQDSSANDQADNLRHMSKRASLLGIVQAFEAKRPTLRRSAAGARRAFGAVWSGRKWCGQGNLSAAA